MQKIDNFINLYKISKTLRFALKPVGKTEEHFNSQNLLEKDKERANNYLKVKKFIDEYHKHFIETSLKNADIVSLKEYADLYFSTDEKEKKLDKMIKLEEKMRKDISDKFKAQNEYDSLFKEDIITNLLPKIITSEEELKIIDSFYGFSTYFRGFHENRKNIYSKEKQSTAISYRCINDNLPRFLDNIKSFDKIKKNLDKNSLKELDELCEKITEVYLKNIFDIEYFNMVLNQTGIDKYNQVISGYATKKGEKVKGINEYINLYNQQIAKNDKTKKIPLLKILYKQILSDKDSLSFLPESFEKDNDVIESVEKFFSSGILETLDKIENLFNGINEYDLKGIFVKSGSPINDISNEVFKQYDFITNCWNKEYEMKYPLMLV